MTQHFAIDLGQASDNHTTHNSLTDVVRDQLRPGHSADEFHYAYAETVKHKMEEYKQHQWLLRFWFSQSGALFALGEADPVLFIDLVNHLAAKLDELT